MNWTGAPREAPATAAEQSPRSLRTATPKKRPRATAAEKQLKAEQKLLDRRAKQLEKERKMIARAAEKEAKAAERVAKAAEKLRLKEEATRRRDEARARKASPKTGAGPSSMTAAGLGIPHAGARATATAAATPVAAAPLPAMAASLGAGSAGVTARLAATTRADGERAAPRLAAPKRAAPARVGGKSATPRPPDGKPAGGKPTLAAPKLVASLKRRASRSFVREDAATVPTPSRKRKLDEVGGLGASADAAGPADGHASAEDDGDEVEMTAETVSAATEALGGQSDIARDKAMWVSLQLGFEKWKVSGALSLFEEGNTVPFIARYRKERTGAMDEEALRQTERLMQRAEAIETKRLSVALTLHKQECLNDDLRTTLLSASTVEEVEDVWRPFKEKRQTRAQVAQQRGLAPLADLVEQLGAARRHEEPAAVAGEYVNEELGVASAADALAGARDIVAERQSHSAEVRQWAREALFAEAKLTSKLRDPDADPSSQFQTYWNFEARLSHVKPYQFLALQRGAAAKVLTLAVALDDYALASFTEQYVAWPASEGHERLSPDAPSPARDMWQQERRAALVDAFKRLIRPSLEREWRRQLKEHAEDDAFNTYRRNLFAKLLTPPLRQHPEWGDAASVSAVLGIDPAYRTGCKLALVNATGQVLRTSTVYPHPPHQDSVSASSELECMLRLGCQETTDADAPTLAPPRKRLRASGRMVCSIGNGTASRETEAWLRPILQHRAADHGSGAASAPDVGYCIVDEAGASVYSACPLAKRELPDLDVTIRGAVSIARRLLDPLAELVKIDPKSIGVGLYQHDVDQRRLGKELAAAVEDCVNAVGVDVNTASPALLERVAGLSSAQSNAIVSHREARGAFASRRALLSVKGIGPRTFQQAAGFLRIHGGDEALDATPVHPESYSVARVLQQRLGEHCVTEALAQELGVGLETLKDIHMAISGTAPDPRSGQPPPHVKVPGRLTANEAVDAQEAGLVVESLQPGLRLQGVVRNVVAFGAFVDIGVGHDGLLHVSRYGEKLRSGGRGADALRVNDRIDVTVLEAQEASSAKGGGKDAKGNGRRPGKAKWRISLAVAPI